MSGSVTMFLNFSLQTKSTDGYAAVGNIEPDTLRALHLKTAGSHPRSIVPALTRSTLPKFEHPINLVANCVSGIHAAKSLHQKAIVLRMPVADGRHHRCS